MSAYTVKLRVGDRLPLLVARLWDSARDNDLSASTVSFTMYDSAGTAKVNAGSCSIQTTRTFTADTTNWRFNAVGHGMQNGWEVIVSNSGGALPTPLSASTRYFVIEAAPNYFKLATRPDGEVITPTGAGTGTHSIVPSGQVSFAWGASDTDTAGTYKGFFLETTGGKTRRWPQDSSQFVEVVITGTPS